MVAQQYLLTLLITTGSLLAAGAIGDSRADDARPPGVNSDLLTATPGEFCNEAQRIVSNTEMVGHVTVHSEADDFVRSKTSIQPLNLHAFVWTDESGRAIAISCKLKSADHLNTAHGDGTAGPDGLCQDMNRATYQHVRQTLGQRATRPAQRSRTAHSGRFEADLPTSLHADRLC